eukprot:PhF_6_TR29530/c0_g1_i1/m.43712
MESDPNYRLVTAAKAGDIPTLRSLLDDPQPVDVNVRSLVLAKGRLIGIKIYGEGEYIMSASSQERMMGTALHFAAMGLKADALGYLMARGGDPNIRCGVPPHLPHEPNVSMILKQHKEGSENHATADLMIRFIQFFNVWKQIDFANEKKLLLLSRGVMEGRQELREILIEYVADVRSGKVVQYTAPAQDPNLPDGVTQEQLQEMMAKAKSQLPTEKDE